MVRGSNPGEGEIFRACPDRNWGLPSLLYNGYQVFPEGVTRGWGVTLTPHPLLVPWSRKGRAIPLLPLWAIRPVQSLSACTRVTFNFSFFTFPVHSVNKRRNIRFHRQAPFFCSGYLCCGVQNGHFPYQSHHMTPTLWSQFISPVTFLDYKHYSLLFQRNLNVTVLTFHVGGSTWHRVPPLGRMHQQHQMMRGAVVTLATTSDRQTSSRQHWNQQSALARHTPSRMQAHPNKTHHQPTQCMHFQ